MAPRSRVELRFRTGKAGLIAALAIVASGCDRGILDPVGPVGAAEKTILINSTAIMLAIVIPTMLATAAVAWWFRRGNSKAEYRPDWEYSGAIEMVVWSIPVGTTPPGAGLAGIIGAITLPDAIPYKGIVLSVDAEGVLTSVYDADNEGVVAWNSRFAGGQKVLTRAEVVTALGKVYVATNDGNVHQLDLASGAAESRMPVQFTSGFHTAADLLIYPFQGEMRLVGSSFNAQTGQVTRQYKIPCQYAETACRNAV